MQDSDERVEILKWLREYYPDAQIDELPRSLSPLTYAMRRENCHRSCPGVLNCPTYGYVMKPYRVMNGNKIIFGTAGEQCQKWISEKSQAVIHKTAESCGVPDRYSNCTFENYDVLNYGSKVQMALSAAIKCTQDNKSLVLGGPPGTGKTHLAVAQVKEYLRSGKSALFMPVITILDEIKKTFGTNNTAAVEDAIKKADFVVLDDLGTQYDTEWAAERLFSLIDYRYSHKLPMTITTNADNIGMLETMAGKTSGFRIVSRIKDEDFGHVHWMTGCRDFRGIRKQGKVLA